MSPLNMIFARDCSSQGDGTLPVNTLTISRQGDVIKTMLVEILSYCQLSYCLQAKLHHRSNKSTKLVVHTLHNPSPGFLGLRETSYQLLIRTLPTPRVSWTPTILQIPVPEMFVLANFDPASPSQAARRCQLKSLK